jgi:hypothetical protein
LNKDLVDPRKDTMSPKGKTNSGKKVQISVEEQIIEPHEGVAGDYVGRETIDLINKEAENGDITQDQMNKTERILLTEQQAIGVDQEKSALAQQ